MSLRTAHPLWTTAGCSPVKVTMATVQAQMLSGRYRTDYLCRHWSKHKSGFSLLSASCSTIFWDLPHLIETCPALHPTREKLMSFTRQFVLTTPHQSELILCAMTEVIKATQIYGPGTLHHLFHVTRTWIYLIHRERLKCLGRWNIL